jgi:hypothetical protein
MVVLETFHALKMLLGQCSIQSLKRKVYNEFKEKECLYAV